MQHSTRRIRMIVGGAFSLALITAPLGVLAATPSGAVTGHTLRPYLAASPKTFPPADATYTVNTTADSHDAAPGNGICDDGTGHCSLRAAVEEASADGVTVNVILPAGTYGLSSAFGPLNPTDAGGLQIVGAGAGTTQIVGASDIPTVDVTQDASTNGSFLELTNVLLQGTNFEVMDIEDGNDVVVMTGSTVNGGSNVSDGGGVYNEGQLWATNTTFSNNTSTFQGGAINNDERLHSPDE